MFDANQVDAQHRIESLLSTRSLSVEYGGADRDRTGGLLVANQALSQLSYSPNRKVSMSQSFEDLKETSLRL